MNRIPGFHIRDIKGNCKEDIDHFSSISPRVGESIVSRKGKVYEVIDIIHSSWWTNANNMTCQIDIVVKVKPKTVKAKK